MTDHDSTPDQTPPTGTLADLSARGAVAAEIVAQLARSLEWRATPESQGDILRRNSLLALAQADDLLAVLREQEGAPSALDLAGIRRALLLARERLTGQVTLEPPDDALSRIVDARDAIAHALGLLGAGEAEAT